MAGPLRRGAEYSPESLLGPRSPWPSRRRGGAVSGGLPERAAVAPVGRSARPPRAVVAMRPVRMVAGLGRRILVLGPLGAKAEALQLAQVDLVEIRRRIILGSVVVHVVRSARCASGDRRPRVSSRPV